MTILDYKTCNGETYAMLKHDQTDETYPSTQFYSFPYTEENIKCLRRTLGANSGGLILEPLENYALSDIHTLSVFTFTNKERDTVTAALALGKNNEQISLKISLDDIFPIIIYDIFKNSELNQLVKDNALQYKHQPPYNDLLKDYEKPDPYGIGLHIDEHEIQKGEHLMLSGFKTFMPDKPDVIEVSINENGVLYGIIASLEHVNPDGSKLTYMAVEAQKENISKDDWLTNAIADETIDVEATYQKKIDELKQRYDLNDHDQREQYTHAVERQKRAKNNRLKRAVENLSELDDEAFVVHLSKGQVHTLINRLTLLKRWKTERDSYDKK